MSVITQEVHIQQKKFGRNTISAIVDTVENALKNSPETFSETSEYYEILKLFSNTIYDEDTKKLQMIEFVQFGDLFIVQVYDTSYKVIAYSVFDIISYFNDTHTDNCPYIFLKESTSKLNFRVFTVPSPTSYTFKVNSPIIVKESYAALYEICKYQILFIDGKKESEEDNVSVMNVMCNPAVFKVGQEFTEIDRIDVFNSDKTVSEPVNDNTVDDEKENGESETNNNGNEIEEENTQENQTESETNVDNNENNNDSETNNVENDNEEQTANQENENTGSVSETSEELGNNSEENNDSNTEEQPETNNNESNEEENNGNDEPTGETNTEETETGNGEEESSVSEEQPSSGENNETANEDPKENESKSVESETETTTEGETEENISLDNPERTNETESQE